MPKLPSKIFWTKYGSHNAIRSEAAWPKTVLHGLSLRAGRYFQKAIRNIQDVLDTLPMVESQRDKLKRAQTVLCDCAGLLLPSLERKK